LKKIFLFWLSLASTTFFMALEGPICTAVISRLADSELNLAAFGVALAFALLFQSPVLRIMSLPLMFVKDRQSYLSLRRFVLVVCSINCLVFFSVLTEPFYSNVVVTSLGIKPELRDLVRAGLLVWSIFPLLNGLRRFYQGILLCAHEPKKIAVGTFIRLVTLSVVILFLSYTGIKNGVLLGVIATGSGMLVELLVSAFFARVQVGKFMAVEEAHGTINLTNSTILKAFIPLSVSTIVALSGGAILSAFTARGQLSIESLALLPVVFGLLNPFSWSAFAAQDTTHALISRGKYSYDTVRRFSVLIGLMLSLILFVVGHSPLSEYYYLMFNHLPENLYSLTPFPTLVIVFIPFTIAVKNFYRGVIIARGNTRLLLISESFEVLVLVTVFFTLIYLFSVPAINLAMISLWMASFINLCLLWWWERRSI
jgi:Na+-driven multidrug efflux pump